MRAKLNLNIPAVHSKVATAFTTLTMKFVDDILSVTNTEELDVAVHGLASRAFHDNVDGFSDIGGQDFVVASKESMYFCFGETVGNLFTISIRPKGEDAVEQLVA